MNKIKQIIVCSFALLGVEFSYADAPKRQSILDRKELSSKKIHDEKQFSPVKKTSPEVNKLIEKFI